MKSLSAVFGLVAFLSYPVLATINTCVNLWTPFLIKPGNVINTGPKFQQLYSNWPNYNKYHRISKICIRYDTANVNGPKKRINGFLFTAKNVQTATATVQTQCYGACTGGNKCTDVKGEIVNIEFWYSGGSTTSSYAIDTIKFRSSSGQEIVWPEILADQDKSGTQVTNSFTVPWIGAYVYHSAIGLDNVGWYHGRFDKPGCDCCSGSSFNYANGLTDITYVIKSPAMAAQVRNYPGQLPMCKTYSNLQCPGTYTYQHVTSACNFVSFSTSSSTPNTQIQISVATTDVSKVGVHTCKQRAYMNNQSPRVNYDQEFKVTITCLIASYVRANSAWAALTRHKYGESTKYLNFSFTATPAGCYTEAYVGTLSGGAALPSSIVVDTPNKRVAISTPTGLNVATGEGIYNIVLTSTLSNVPTNTANIQNVAQINIYNCAASTFQTQNFGTLAYNVANVAVTRAFITYKDDRSLTYGDGTGIDLCGARTYAFTAPANHATFAVIQNPSTNNYLIKVETSSDALVGTHLLKLKVSLASYPTRFIEETLTVTIATCLVSYLPTKQYNTNYRYIIGSGLLTIPEIPFVLNPLTACGYTETRTGHLTPETTLPTAITYVQGTGFKIQVTDIYQAGRYVLMQKNVLDDAAGSTDVSRLFTIDLDPCGEAGGIDNQAITNMAAASNQDKKVIQQMKPWITRAERLIKKGPGGQPTTINCLDRLFTFKVNGIAEAPDTSYLQYDTKLDQIVIDTAGKQIPGSGEQNVEMTITLASYNWVNRKVNFKLYAISGLYPPVDFPVRETQYVGGQPRYISYSNFWGTGIHPDEITYKVLANDSSMPEQIIYDNTNHTFIVKGNFEKNDTLEMSVVVGLAAYPDFQAPFNWTLEIIRNYTQAFAVLNLPPQIDLPWDQINQFEVLCGQSYEMRLPAPYDEENDYVSMVVEFDGAIKKIARWMELTKTIEISEGDVTWAHDGRQKVTVKLSDSAGQKRNYQFDIVIDCPKPPPLPPKPLTFQQLEALKPPPIDLLPVGLQEISIEEFSQPFLAQIDNKGLVEIGFEKFLTKAPNMKELKTQKISLMINDKKVEKPALEISVDSDTEIPGTALTWDVIEVTSKGMKIQVKFDKPEAISAQTEPDALKIVFWNLDAFKGQTKEEYLCKEGDEICQFIEAEEARKKKEKAKSRRLQSSQMIKPGFFIEKRMLPQVEVGTNRTAVAYWVTFSIGIVFVTLAAIGLKYSFNAGSSNMRVILSISHICTFYNLFLINVQSPAFLMSFAKGFMSTVLQWQFLWDMFTYFGWYDGNKLFESAEDLSQQLQVVNPEINPSFITLGYNSTMFTRNLGMVLFFYIGMLVLMMLSCACNFKGSHQIVNKNLLTYGEFVGIFAFQVYLPLVFFGTSNITLISAILNMYYGASFDSGFSAGLERLMACVFVAGIIFFDGYVAFRVPQIIKNSGLMFRANAVSKGQVLNQKSQKEQEDEVLEEILDEMSDSSASEEDYVVREQRKAEIAKKKKEGDFPDPPPGFKYIISYENVLQMARINHMKEEKFQEFARQKAGVLTIFNFDKVFAGTSYLSAILFVQIAHSCTFVFVTHLQGQLGIIFLTQTVLVFLAGQKNLFVHKRDQVCELANLGCNMGLTAILTVFTQQSGDIQKYLETREKSQYLVICFLGLQLLVNSITIMIELVQNCNSVKYKATRHRYLKQKNTVASRRINRDLIQLTAREPLTVIREDSQFDMEAHEEQVELEERQEQDKAMRLLKEQEEEEQSPDYTNSEESEDSEVSEKPRKDVEKMMPVGNFTPIIEDSREEEDASGLKYIGLAPETMMDERSPVQRRKSTDAGGQIMFTVSDEDKAEIQEEDSSEIAVQKAQAAEKRKERAALRKKKQGETTKIVADIIQLQDVQPEEDKERTSVPVMNKAVDSFLNDLLYAEAPSELGIGKKKKKKKKKNNLVLDSQIVDSVLEAGTPKQETGGLDLLGDETSALAKAYNNEVVSPEVSIQAEEEASNIDSQATSRKKKKKKRNRVNELSAVPEQSNMDDSF